MIRVFGGLFSGCSAKFMSLVGIGIVAVSLVVGIAYFNLNELSGTVEVLVQSRIPIAVSLGEMRTQINGMGRELLVANLIEAPTEREKILKKIEDRIKITDAALETLGKQALLARNLELLGNVRKNWHSADDKIKQTIAKISKEYGNRELASFVLELTHEMEVINADLKEMGSINAERNAAIEKSSLETISNSVRILLGFALSAYVILLVLGIWMASQMRSSLTKITDQISEAGALVRNASSELSGASQSLANSQTETAASLEETVASVEELSSIVAKNADQAKIAAGLSTESEEIARVGKQEVQKLIASVQSIAESSAKIDEIIAIIDDIAFQTNLLALNAAVEAARAGEQGKGFAVVAEAVRALAHRSSAAAKDISSLISQSVSQSKNGAKLAVESGEVLEKVTHSIKKVTDLNKEMAESSGEQATGLKQISKAMNQLDQATQGNSASAEQTAATSEEMTQQAVSLSKLVLDLQLVVAGKSAKTESNKIAA